MASPSETARAAILGIPLDPNKKPDRVMTVKAFEQMDAKVIGVAAGAIIRDTLAGLGAVTNPPARQMAWVLGDAAPANNGVYENTGSPSAPVWVRRGDLPYSFIRMINAGAGTADAILATSTLPAPSAIGAALFSINIVAANTGNVTINTKPLRTNSGNEIAPGGLTAGSIHAFLDMGDQYRLLSDQASGAIVAAAEAAQLAAEAAAAAAGGTTPVADRAALKALDTSAKKAALIYGEGGRNGTFVFVSGDQSAHVSADADEHTWVAPGSDATGASGAWLRTPGSFAAPVAAPSLRTIDAKLWDRPDLRDWNGLDLTGANDASGLFQAAVNGVGERTLHLPDGKIRLDPAAPIVIPAGVSVRGTGYGLQNYNHDFSAARGTRLLTDTTGIDAIVQMGWNTEISHLAMLFDGQPAPGTGWTPVTTPWAIMAGDPAYSAGSGRQKVHDLAILAFSHGIAGFRGFAQGEIYSLQMDCFRDNIYLDAIFDVVRVRDIHQWVFWSVDADTLAYRRGNTRCLRIARCDNPIINDIFSYAAQRTLFFDASAYPAFLNTGAKKVHASNVEGDSYGSQAVYATSAITDRLTGSITGLSAQRSSTALVDGHAVSLDCQHEFAIINMDSANAGAAKPGSHVRTSAADSVLTLISPRLVEWDANATGAVAIDCVNASSEIIVTDFLPVARTGQVYYGGTKAWAAGNVRFDTKYRGRFFMDGSTTTNAFPRLFGGATRLGAGNYSIPHNLNWPVANTVVNVTPIGIARFTATWDVANSTATVMRIRVHDSSGAAADAPFAFEISRC